MVGFFSGRDFDFALKGDPLVFAQVLSQDLDGSLVCLDEEFGQYRVVKMERGGMISIDLSSLKGNSIEEDLKRRDFTINSMALDVKGLFEREDLSIIDPLGGLKDLNEKRIRLSSPVALSEDPVRMIRAVRIARQYQFTIDQNLKKVMKQKKELISNSSPERIKAELFKIVDNPGIDESLMLLHELNLLELLIPEVNAFREYGQGEYHRYDLWEHSLKTAWKIELILDGIDCSWPAYSSFLIDYFLEWIEGEVRQRSLLKFTAFLHDVGKPLTRTGEEGKIRFFGHEREGGRINRKIARRFRLGKKAQKYMEVVTKNHMRILNLALDPKITQRAKYRFFRDLGDTGLDILFLSLADAWATGKDIERTGDYAKVNSIVNSFIEYYFSEYGKQPLKPLLSGDDIMQIFNLPEGKRVGELLDMIKEAEAQGEIANREEAITFLKGRVSCD